MSTRTTPDRTTSQQTPPLNADAGVPPVTAETTAVASAPAPGPSTSPPVTGDAAPAATAGSGQTSRDASPPGAAPAGTPARNLVVCQLPRSVDTKMLRAIFSEFGELVTALVMMDVQSGKSRGFGFVWFRVPEDAQRAMSTMNGRELEEGRKLKVFPSEHPDGLSEAAAIDVLNFPAAVAHSATGRRIFAQYGTVVRYELAPFDGRASGSGSAAAVNTTVTVEYSTILEARAAVNALHGVRELSFEELQVNLQLPLVTKYLISGAHRPASRTPKAGSPSVSTSSNPAAMRRSHPGPMGASGSGFRSAMGTHAHPMAPPPAYVSPGASGASNPMAMSQPGAVHPQPVFMMAPPQQSGGVQPGGVFQLPTGSLGGPAPQGSVFMPQQQQQQQGQQQQQPMFLPPGYVMVPMQQHQQQQQQQQQQQHQPQFIMQGGQPMAFALPPQPGQQQPSQSQQGQQPQPFFFAPQAPQQQQAQQQPLWTMQPPAQ